MDIEEVLCSFKYDVANLLNNDKLHRNFRYQTLLLISKYFNFNMLIFTVLDDQNKEGECKIELNKVTLGIPTNMIRDYYSYYHSLDPFRTLDLENKIINLNEIIPEEKFLETRYYTEYFKKYSAKYQVTTNIQSENRAIGQLVLLKTEKEGPFSKKEMYIISEINNIVTTEFIKAIKFKKLYLEMSFYKELSTTFPIAQIILDSSYDVNFYNSYAKDYIEELTGANIKYFKYFFINEIMGAKNIISEIENAMIEIENFYLKIVKKNKIATSEEYPNINYVVYIVKKMKTTTINLNSRLIDCLTKREKEVANLIRLGYSNKEIARTLEVSNSTVKSHVQNIFEKCNAKNRIHLVNKLYIED